MTVVAWRFASFDNPRTFCQKILGHACDGRYVPLVDVPRGFIYFAAPDFVRRIDTLPDAPQHDYFLNRLETSSWCGVMPLGVEFASGHDQALVALISSLILTMVAVYVVALPFMLSADLRNCRAYLGPRALMVAFLVALRIWAPNEFHEDWRHMVVSSTIVSPVSKMA